LSGVVRRAVECDGCVDSELAVGDEAIVQFKCGHAARCTVADKRPGRKCVELVATERRRLRIVGAVGGPALAAGAKRQSRMKARQHSDTRNMAPPQSGQSYTKWTHQPRSGPCNGHGARL
jgi:hypothetical protein